MLSQGTYKRSSLVSLPMGILAHQGGQTSTSCMGQPYRSAKKGRFCFISLAQQQDESLFLWHQLYKSIWWIKTGPARRKHKPRVSDLLFSPLAFTDRNLLQDFWSNQLRLSPPPAPHWAWMKPDHPWGQPGCSWNVRGSPSSLRSSTTFWAMGIDFRHCFRAKLKAYAFAACQALRPVFHKGLCTSSLVPGAFESRARPSEACFLTPWDLTVTPLVNIFILLTSVHRVLRPGEKEGWREGKTQGLQSLVWTRCKQNKNVNTLGCLCLWYLFRVYYPFEKVCVYSTDIYYTLWWALGWEEEDK